MAAPARPRSARLYNSQAATPSNLYAHAVTQMSPRRGETMRFPVHPRSLPHGERSRADDRPAPAVHSLESVLWDIGVVLAAFLGLALAVSATLMAFGIN